jgi:hypothetical protein
MVKPRQMEDAMEDEDLDFNSRRMSEPRGILYGDVSGNCDVASEVWTPLLRFGRTLSRKRQDVCGCVFAPEATIQRADCDAPSHQNVDGATHSGAAARTRDKTYEGCLAQTYDFFLQNHHTAFYGPLYTLHFALCN